MSIQFALDPAPAPCHAHPMNGPRPPGLDQVHGARAAGALLVGELDEAEEHLGAASSRYLVGFFLRLAFITPGVSLRLAWRIARRRLVRSRFAGPS